MMNASHNNSNSDRDKGKWHKDKRKRPWEQVKYHFRCMLTLDDCCNISQRYCWKFQIGFCQTSRGKTTGEKSGIQLRETQYITTQLEVIHLEHWLDTNDNLVPHKELYYSTKYHFGHTVFIKDEVSSRLLFGSVWSILQLLKCPSSLREPVL